MRFKCGRERGWHRWFAWYPVRVADRDCRWLEVVQRQWISSLSDYWQYKAL